MLFYSLLFFFFFFFFSLHFTNYLPHPKSPFSQQVPLRLLGKGEGVLKVGKMLFLK